MGQVPEQQWLGALGHLLARSHVFQPDELAATVEAAVAPLGLHATIYLIDYEQVMLRALPVPGRPTPAPLPVDASLAGQAFVHVTAVPAGADDQPRLWLPVVDGTDRLGVVEFTLPAGADATDPVLHERCMLLAGLVGHLVVAKVPHGDHLTLARRSRPMTTGAELLWAALPPLTSTTDRMTISAVLQPCYDVGGDGFDYAIDGSTVTFALLDAMGRGLQAGLACGVALAAIRAARRTGGGLEEQARAVDTELDGQFEDTRFVTAVLAQLDLVTGRLSYINAGQPAPLLLDEAGRARQLTGGHRMPLGLGDRQLTVAHEVLQPNDRILLHSDGVTESRTPAGDRLGVPGLLDLAEQHHRAGLPAPETLRRLAHAALARQRTGPVDDATLMLVAWSPADVQRTVPQPVRHEVEGDER